MHQLAPARRPGLALRPRRSIIRRLAVALAATVVAATACGRPGARPGGAGAPASPVWLCRPGAPGDPCAISLKATVVPPSGAPSVIDPAPAAAPATDCFYIYPTVSRERTLNADLRVQPAETEVAKVQAAPFSTVCRVWSPVYRQVTAAGLVHLYLSGSGSQATKRAFSVAYDSLQTAFDYYLARFNGGRPIVIVAHSQGAVLAIELLQKIFDDHPGVRGRLLMAVILGGNVTVRAGSSTGGTFQHIPACSHLGQTGCVLAYSSYGSRPPADAFFGYPRPVAGTVSLPGQSPAGHRVLCVNPAAIGGGTATLQPWFPAAGPDLPAGITVATPWVRYPDLYRATCREEGGATWLQVTPVPGSIGNRPLISRSSQVTPRFGYHVGDVNLATGNLLADVAAAERTRAG